MTNRDEKGRFVKANRDDELSREEVENRLLGMVSSPKTSTPSIEEIRVEAYKRGYSDGFQYGQNVTICGRKNSVVWTRAKSSFMAAIKHWQTILIVVLIGWMAFDHFTQGTVRPPTPTPSPAPIIVQSEIDRIVSQSPSNPTQRESLVKGYKNVIASIEAGWIQGLSDAQSKAREETAPVLKLDAWKETSDQLGSYIGNCFDLSTYKNKLHEIIAAFDK